jgi:thioredoxin reductase
MWSNTPKELMEFYDYTFGDHIKQEAPAFLPRKDLLDYLIARNSVDGALDGVKFNHTVLSVTYNESSAKFTVKVRDDATGAISNAQYDKCIWAAGLHGAGEKPDDLVDLLADFTGTVLHSIEATENFKEHVKRKKVFIIGDSFSAEDLALRAVKLGAKHVYVSARSGDGNTSDTKSWPEDKVTVIFGPPYKLTKGNTFKCQPVYYSAKKQRWRRDDEEETVKVKDIDTVVMCTGYLPNSDMMAEDLKLDDEAEWEISKGWTMPNNSLTITVGNPTPNKYLDVGATCYPTVYRGLLISNPSMMYLCETFDTVSSFLDLDVLANLLLGYLTGAVEIPKEKDMIKENKKQLEDEMQLPWLRLAIDPAYRAELDELPDGHWSENEDDERSVILNRKPCELMVRRLARDMKASGYPVDFGDWKNLSKKGVQMVDMMIAAGLSRSKIPSEDSSWKTFRDADPTQFVSVHSGAVAAPLSRPWIEKGSR